MRPDLTPPDPEDLFRGIAIALWLIAAALMTAALIAAALWYFAT